MLAGVVPGAATAAPPSSGTFSVLSYNVAGLPEGLSSGNPRVNTPIIGQRIRPYDVVHVQEDFNYHASLYAGNTHPFRTPTSGGVPFGDGLNTLSDHPYSDLARDRWDRCNGTDCLTPKGFTFSRIRVAEGVLIDFYNVHANAGSAEADLAARRANISELSRFVTANSAGNAVVIAGDTNTRYTRAADNIRELLSANGLKDAWVEEERGGVQVVKSWDVAQRTGVVELVHQITADGPFYLRVRGTDGKRSAPGHHGAAVDPAGPALGVAGQSDPWEDLWFYSNPVFAVTER
ncbi:endonuclease [Lentzea sp. NPDC051208]|uniref:endonuclease n=1 Tax=Lentzea sp. NPDC051208 TaxID=3154642 RepID=UPI0034331241